MFHPCSIQCAQSCSVPSALSLIEYASRVRTRVLVAGSGVSVSYKSNGGIRPFSPASSVASPRFSLFAFDAISSATTMVQGRSEHRASVPSLCTTSPPEFPPFPFALGVPPLSFSCLFLFPCPRRDTSGITLESNYLAHAAIDNSRIDRSRTRYLSNRREEAIVRSVLSVNHAFT